MKISLIARVKNEADIEISVEGSPSEISDVISKPLEAIGTATIPLILEKLTTLFDKPNNDLREKLQKEDKRLELAIPKLKEMQQIVFLEIEEVDTKVVCHNTATQAHKNEKLSDLRAKYNRIGDELNSIHARRKQIRWALSQPDKK